MQYIWNFLQSQHYGTLLYLLRTKQLKVLIINYNHGHNILRMFDILANIPFTASERKRDY